MSITFGIGLQDINEPGGEEHAKRMKTFWSARPGDPEIGDRLRDLQTVQGIDTVFEMTPDGELIALEEKKGRKILDPLYQELDVPFVSWNDELAGEFHFRVPAVILPWPFNAKDMDSDAGYVRSVISRLYVDERSSVIRDYGLLASDAVRINQNVNKLADKAVENQFVMAYG